MAKIDLKAARTKKGRPLRPLFPLGKTTASIQWIEKTLSSKKGTPRLTVSFQGELGAAKGKKISMDLYLSESAVWKLGEFCIAAGVDADSLDSDNTKELLDLFVGKEIVISVSPDMYKDKDGNDKEGRVISSIGSLDATIQAKLVAMRAERLGDGAHFSDEVDGEGEAEDDAGETEETASA